MGEYNSRHNILNYSIALSANTSWYLYNFRKGTIEAMLKDGHNVCCISPRDEYTDRLIELGCSWREVNIGSRGLNLYSELKTILRIYSSISSYKPDILFNFTIKNNIYGTICAYFQSIKVINNISGLGEVFINKRIVYKYIQRFYKFILSFSDKIFYQNEDDLNIILKNSSIKRNITEYIPGSGVNTARFNIEYLHKKQSDDKTFKFIYAGRLLVEKGIYELIESIKKINNTNIQARLLVVGISGKENISIKKNIKEWSSLPGVEFFEMTDSIEDFLKMADCLVLPSYREGLSRSILEANAMGLPVICSDVPGCNNIIKDSINGFLCIPRNADSLRRTMEKMMNLDYSDLQLMGKRGRKIVIDEYDEKVVIDQYLNCLELMLKK